MTPVNRLIWCEIAGTLAVRTRRLGMKGDIDMLGRRQKEVQALVHEHLELVEGTVRLFLESIRAYLVDGDVETASERALETHRAEGRADDARRRIENHLLAGSLLPNARKDILELIEQVDRLANAAEGTLDYLLIQRIEIPEGIGPMLLEIADISGTIFAEVRAAVDALFADMKHTVEHTRTIESLEGDVDHLERKAGKALFKQDIELARKLQVYGFIKSLVKFSDRAEDLSDLIEVMVAQRHL